MPFRTKRLSQHPPPALHLGTSTGKYVQHFFAHPIEHSGTSIKQRSRQFAQLRHVPFGSAPDLAIALRSRNRCSALRWRPISGSCLAHSAQTPVRVRLPHPAAQNAMDLKTVAKLIPDRMVFTLKRRSKSCRTLAAPCSNHLSLHSRA